MKKINDSQIQSVLQLFSTIHKEAWLVGGCVRDMLMGRKLHDYDITTDATPYEVMALFQGLPRHTNRTEAWYCNRPCTG